jgi:hypothetical protein
LRATSTSKVKVGVVFFGIEPETLARSRMPLPGAVGTMEETNFVAGVSSTVLSVPAQVPAASFQVTLHASTLNVAPAGEAVAV